MKQTYDTLPQPVYKIEFRDDRLGLNSFASTIPTDGNYTDQYSVNNLGFTIQIQNQFQINNKLWLHITSFLEPEHESTQNSGGCYIGVILRKVKI